LFSGFNDPMSVSLLSNIPHYHHLAEAFDKAGALDRYVTVLSQMEENDSPFVPSKIKRKMMNRRLRLASNKVKQLVLPEGLQKIPPKLGFYSNESGAYINNYLFDYFASRAIPESSVVHFVNSIGLITARRAKEEWGATLVCDSRQDHPLFQAEVLDDEARRMGLKTSCIPNLSYRDKMLRELELADHIVVPSTHTKGTFIGRGFDDKKVHVLGYGIETQLFQPVRNPDGVFRVLYTGQIAYRKGVQYLLEAFSRLGLRNAELVLVGGIDPAFKPVLARYDGHFTHIDKLARVDLQKEYARSSVYVLPSLGDSFALTVLEALASGVPVIISESTGARDIVEDGEHGFVVPVRDVDAIAQALLKCYESPELLAKLGENAAVLGQAQTWEKYGSKAIDLYRRLKLI
jgi:glycosyltransferase involved in cell wall biosynthesis